MKYLLLIICTCYLSMVANAQFKVARSYSEQQKLLEEKEKAYQDSIYEKLKNSYDSLACKPIKQAVYGLIGQRLMVKPYYEDYRTGPGEKVKFFTEPDIYKIYEPVSNIKYRNEYDYFFEDNCTKYSAVKERIFTVTNIVDIEDNRVWVFIELTDEKGKLYYRFNKDTEYPDFPFNIEGFIVKTTEIEKKESWAKTIIKGEDVGEDFYTGKKIQFYVGQIWQLKEIIINPENGNLERLYENSKGEVFNSRTESFVFKTKKESDRLKAKYGVSTWKAIMTYSIFKGMPESALIESWGEPEEINYTSYGEQWVYSNGYVYVRKGKVTGWN